MDNTFTSNSGESKARLSLFSTITNLRKLQAYPLKTSPVDWPRWSWITRLRIIGPLVIGMREFLALFLYQLQVRRPWLQQIEFNTQVVTAFRLVNQQLVKLYPSFAEGSDASTETDEELYELQADIDGRLYAFQIVIDRQAHLLQQYETRLKEHTHHIQELQAINTSLFERLLRLEANK